VANARKQYLRQLWKRWGLLGAWHPDSPISVGDVGVMDNWRFERKRSLKDLSVDFELAEAPDTVGTHSYHSDAEIAISAHVSGSAEPAGTGEVELTFGKSGGIAFHAAGTVEVRMNDIGTIEDQIWELHEAGDWEEGRVVVTKVIKAESLAVFVAAKGEASATVTASAADIEIPDFTNLAGLASNFSIKSHKGMETAIVAQGDLTPLFEAICMDRKGILRHRRIAAATPRGRLLDSDLDENAQQDLRFIQWSYDLDDNEHQ